MNLRMDDELIFDRALEKKIARSEELKFVLRSGEEFSGFITGVDDFWIQVLDSETGRWGWIQQDSIDMMKETGRTAEMITDPRIRKEVEQSTYKLRNIARQSKES